MPKRIILTEQAKNVLRQVLISALGSIIAVIFSTFCMEVIFHKVTTTTENPNMASAPNILFGSIHNMPGSKSNPASKKFKITQERYSLSFKPLSDIFNLKSSPQIRKGE